MADYKILYHKLFNKITDVIEELHQIQRETEELYLIAQDAELTVLKNDKSASATNAEPPAPKSDEPASAKDAT